MRPATGTDRLRQVLVARMARNHALAYYIDGLVRSGEVADLAVVARMCGVSRMRITAVIALLAVS
ncbi:MAG: hypothetical protein C0404_11885 [Verrucomicrobia bacterium]|nr:hypothetical protein [Verrucomicrobiota bacterium]